MDRSWMYGKRDFNFGQKLETFITAAIEHQTREEESQIICPCNVCHNGIKVKTAKELREHLITKGFTPDYTFWIFHGEEEDNTANDGDYSGDIRFENNMENIETAAEEDNDGGTRDDDLDQVDDVESDNIDEMMDDLEKDFVHCPEMFQRMVSDSKKSLYSSCSKFTRLSAVLKLYTLKAGNGWSDKSFTALLELLSQMLPEGNELPTTTYGCKKILCPLATRYQKIHACPNDCILYWNDHSKIEECPRCGAPRYKLIDDAKGGRKGGPAKTLWYLPIIPRFKRLFANPKDAKRMLWHHEEKNKDGKLRHVADAPQWRTFDRTFPNFGKEPRNLRLGLCTDGNNPFGTLSSQHSSWPIMLIIYNIPPWLTAKSKYILLTLLISGPKQPGNDIDVYLQPLIEDLKMLWDNGVRVYDAVTNSRFTMHAMLYCTINDFPAYGNLSGYRLKTDKGCPDETNDKTSDKLKKKNASKQTKENTSKQTKENASKQTKESRNKGRSPEDDATVRSQEKIYNSKKSLGKRKSNESSVNKDPGVEQKKNRSENKASNEKLKKNVVPDDRIYKKLFTSEHDKIHHDHIPPLTQFELTTVGPECEILEGLIVSMESDSITFVKIDINSSVYSYKDNIVVHLSFVDIRQMIMFKNQWLNVSLIQVWGRFVYYHGTSIGVTKDHVGYMCPVELSSYLTNSMAMETYVTQVLKSNEHMKYIIGAFYVVNHWMMVVFCTRENVAYILDSNKKGNNSMKIQQHLNMAWKIYILRGGKCKPRSNELTIKTIECPQQPGDFECGYYVMKWMYDITVHYANSTVPLEQCISKSTVAAKDINRVREFWCRKFVEGMYT